MQRGIILSVLTLVIAIFALGQAPAEDRQTVPPVTFVAGAGSSMSVLREIEKYASPIVQPVGCRADCDGCRQSCYARMRAGCNTDVCRRAFSQCMKGCWNNVCKYC